MITVTTQTCRQCRRTKPLAQFPPDERNMTGRASVCNPCVGRLRERAANPPPPCRNPRGRDRCIGVAANRRHQLCTSCVAHERYLAKTSG